jgi:inner membrane protein
MRFPIIGKGLALGGVTLGLLWALALVSDVVAEREGRLREAQRGIADSLAGAQTLAGPVLQRYCSERWKVEQGEGKDRRWVDQQRDFSLAALPQRLSVGAASRIEPRRRGIFRINSYAVKASLQADWSDLQALQPPAAKAGVEQRCGEPVLWVGVADPRGIRSATVSLAGSELAVRPGTPSAQVPRGFQAGWPAGRALDGAAPLSAVVTLDLVGTEDLSFVPLGEQSSFRLGSDWPHPSFNGRFLPGQRSVGAAGFEAEWRLSALASSSGQELLAGHGLCAAGEPLPIPLPMQMPATAAQLTQTAPPCIERFGVAFIDPVSTYVLSDRATKYGLLFIVLSFVAVGLVEVMRRLRVHPVQYALVGSALASFFLLLVSLSEHIPFALAYAAAASACTLLLGYYGAHVLRGWRAGLAFAGGIGTLYALLYLLLRSEQSALVLGSVLLFVVLAAVMVVTRRIDWYALAARVDPPPARSS